MSRRLVRELAFQIIFQVDIGHIPWKEALTRTSQDYDLPTKSRIFLEELVGGVINNLEWIDNLLTEFSTEWPLQRMANTDRNILRLAVYELMRMKDVPVEVTVNEAVELAKAYGEADSGRFVNGVLGNMIRKISRAVQAEGPPLPAETEKEESRR
ncbi:MAG TPA: transcription antitermination factor NusB [Firmicutes bacterium]|nr:transcription antitermination factor NusB [Bacillota bacterium]